MKKDFTLVSQETGVQDAGKSTSAAKVSIVDQMIPSNPANTVVSFPESASSIRTLTSGRFTVRAMTTSLRPVKVRLKSWLLRAWRRRVTPWRLQPL